MRVLLTGAAGQLATSLRKALQHEEIISMSHQDLDVSDASRVRETVHSLRPEVVINAAALRRPDACEKEPAKAFAVNALGARNLAQACAEVGSELVQISSDQVFDGKKTSPYLEEDCPNPLNVYGACKLAGESFARSLTEKHYIVRTSALFGEWVSTVGDANFVHSIIRQAREGKEIRVIDDQRLAPTFTVDLARKIAQLIQTKNYGIYHIANQGECSWYEFAQAICEKLGNPTPVIPTKTELLEGQAPRTRYTVLGSGSLQRLGIADLPPWEDALARYLGELSEVGYL